jgi:hypothetical protein
MSNKKLPAAAQLIQKTVWNLRVDSAWLGSNGHDEYADDAAASQILEQCAVKIRKVADAVERLSLQIDSRCAGERSNTTRVQ